MPSNIAGQYILVTSAGSSAECHHGWRIPSQNTEFEVWKNESEYLMISSWHFNQIKSLPSIQESTCLYLTCYLDSDWPAQYYRCSTGLLADTGSGQASSLLDLGLPTEGFNNKSLSSCTLPQQASAKMPDILNFPSPIPGTFSASCPSVSNHKEKR